MTCKNCDYNERMGLSRQDPKHAEFYACGHFEAAKTAIKATTRSSLSRLGIDEPCPVHGWTKKPCTRKCESAI